jgi:hypothetical protein
MRRALVITAAGLALLAPLAGAKSPARCVTVDTARNEATIGRRAYHYRDQGDALQWQKGTPEIVKVLALAGIDARAASGAKPGAGVVTTCATITK